MAKRTKRTKLQDLPSQADPKAALDSAVLLQASQPVLETLHDDLMERASGSPAVTKALEERHAAEKKAERTADNFAQWQEHFVDQVAAAWFLSCVFVRTLEDRGLLHQPRLAGEGAADSQKLFFELAPSLTERDYLLMVFKELSQFEAAKDLFDVRHNPVWMLAPSAEGAKALLGLFRAPQIEAPAFRFGQDDSRFLGDLYQDINENVRKRFALLQTPRFVESFILDRTLERAIERFGLNETTLIDPTCGSGHFLLGAFERLFDHRLREQPGLDVREAARLALDAVYGADINPYAIAVARFRLALAYLEKAGYDKLHDAPALPLHLVVADSLLHNPHVGQMELGDLAGQSAEVWKGDIFALEDEAAARSILHRKYAAVVGNPPYITVKDKVLRERYRDLYSSAAGKYSLAVPFKERFFQLGKQGAFVGMITANSFMKREFGKKVIQEYLPTVNLDIIINTSGAYIPGHGTPTVLLFGSAEEPKGNEVLTVLASRGEPTTPDVPEKGLVWSSIAAHWSDVGFEDEYITVAKVERAAISQHPWSLGGGGASELKELLETRAEKTLGDIATSIGISCVTGEDEAYLLPPEVAHRLDVGRTRPLVTGEFIRDWSHQPAGLVVFPYGEELQLLSESGLVKELRYLWPYKNVINRRKRFGVPMLERGLTWYELQELYANKLRTPLTITFAFVATHNHFVLDRGGKVFNRSAPIIKLPADATEDDHYALLAYLNSSTACFWMKQVIHKKSSASQKHHTDPARAAYEFAGTALEPLPVPNTAKYRLAELGRRLSQVADERSAWLSGQTLLELAASLEWSASELKDMLRAGWAKYDEDTSRAVYLQEDLDWRVYSAFGLSDEMTGTNLEPRADGEAPLGARPFEYSTGYDAGVSERAKNQASWDTAVDMPPEWKPRLELSKRPRLRVVETREFKRMWRDTERNIDQVEFRNSLPRRWLERLVTDRLEKEFPNEPVTCLTLGTRIDAAMLGVVADYIEKEPSTLLRSLVGDEAVPFTAASRLTAAGLSKHAAWQQTWDLQRREDAGEDVGDIPVPPKYAQKDFRDPNYWRLRGKLDVPKERFISYPGCESDEDGEPVYGWAGWNHLQRAQALAALYQKRKTDEGWGADRLTPMLAGLLELVPWIKQWHNEPSAEFGGLKLGDYFESFVDGECGQLGLTREDLTNWRPPERRKRRGRKKAAKKKATANKTAEGAEA